MSKAPNFIVPLIRVSIQTPRMKDNLISDTTFRTKTIFKERLSEPTLKVRAQEMFSPMI